MSKKDSVYLIQQETSPSDQSNALDRQPIREILEVDPQVKVKKPRATRRKFSVSDKIKIITAFDACNGSLERGALLRKEGLYYASISKWKKDLHEKNPAVKILNRINVISHTPMFNVEETNLNRSWTNEELINYVYPNTKFSPPLKSNYFYTNTGYILTDLIIEKTTSHQFRNELIERTIKLANLKITFYPIPDIENDIKSRFMHGYNYNQYDNPMLVGKDIYENNLSWAAAAGGIVSNAEDIIKWVKALFVEDVILDHAQKQKMQSLISLSTGKPLTQVTKEDPRGFGLGVVQMYDDQDKQLKKYIKVKH